MLPRPHADQTVPKFSAPRKVEQAWGRVFFLGGGGEYSIEQMSST